MNKSIGILAHVDAGKTTFSEQILFHANAIRTPGRVDHGNAYLDTHPLERQRGITIFSDQALFSFKGNTYYWIDTPGHMDFATEMERSVSVMDYAVLLISGTDGVQSHTKAIWSILERFNVPVFIFLNKMDQPEADLNTLIENVKKHFSADAVYADCLKADQMDAALTEAVAERDEALLNEYLEGRFDEALWRSTLAEEIRTRRIFPVLSGSALHDKGVLEFLNVLAAYTDTYYNAEAPFRAQVYKIRHDAHGKRMCFFKVLSGSVSTRDDILLPDGKYAKMGELHLYHGARTTQIPVARAGDICAATGLTGLRPGDIIGQNACCGTEPCTKPMLKASVLWSDPVPAEKVLACLRILEDEEPALCVTYTAATRAIELRIMGIIQTEIIQSLMEERFGMHISFGPAQILYMETVAAPSLGIGHFEPLRHYAEVHLRLVPGPRGSGIRFVSKCHVDDLALNWQRLIETHVFETTHYGVLTGAPLTDVCIELISGRAHLKHTEGGDFRESTYRAIRNALMYAQSILLEPICRFELTAPAEFYGRITGDLLRMNAVTQPAENDGITFSIAGEAAFAEFSVYAGAFISTTRGKGILRYHLDHYAPCRNAEQIIQSANYDPLSDTPHSVFCSHGAGFIVAWDQVRNYAHIPPEI